MRAILLPRGRRSTTLGHTPAGICGALGVGGVFVTGLIGIAGGNLEQARVVDVVGTRGRSPLDFQSIVLCIFLHVSFHNHKHLNYASNSDLMPA